MNTGSRNEHGKRWLAHGQEQDSMCDKCRVIDVNIARCTRLRDQVTDKFFIDGLTDLVKSYSEAKAALHPQEASEGAPANL